MRILITGGSGFIGSALVRDLLGGSDHRVLNFDKLTYAATGAASLPGSASDRYAFVQGDVGDAAAVRAALTTFAPDVVTHLAAETHVDRSIDDAHAFVHTNIVGTHVMLTEVLRYWLNLPLPARERFRFHHISTDEVFGSLEGVAGDARRFTEDTRYDPRSPYSASKAASDHLVSAWGHTYGLPVLITNCSNNYGPYQYPEKLIPLMVVRALAGEQLPVYGAGRQVRDWLHVDDHVAALRIVFERGAPGRTYNIGGDCEQQNIDVVRMVCALLDELAPRHDGASYAAQIAFVQDRPGHDHRYAIDPGRIAAELGWRPRRRFADGMRDTVRWYLDNAAWWQPLLASSAAHRRGLAA